MGQIRKVGDTYYIEFFARGLMYSQIAGPDLAAAQQLLEKTEATIAGGEALTIERHIDLAVFFEQFIAYAGQEFGERSARRFAEAISHIQVFLKQQYPQTTKLAQLTPGIMEGYKAFLSASTKPHLVNFTILLMREMFEYGIKIGFLNDNPSLHVRLLPLPVKKLPVTKRYAVAKELLGKGTGIGKVAKLLGLTDLAQTMYYANLIPLNREDMYN